MANTKGNQYKAWIIDKEFQVCAVDSNQSRIPKSEPGFAADIGISEDGTLWVVSRKPDEPQGGSVIFWSDGDGNWTPITGHGAMQISGGAAEACYFINAEGVLNSLNTSGASAMVYTNPWGPILEADYGGGKIWAVYPTAASGELAMLHHSNASVIQFSPFAEKQELSPTSISASYAGDCYGVLENSPIFFSSDGVTQGSAGSGANGTTERITFKNWNYITVMNQGQNGNQVWEWIDTEGGVYQNAGFSAYSVISSYFA
jgi:hypothetical protein